MDSIVLRKMSSLVLRRLKSLAYYRSCFESMRAQAPGLREARLRQGPARARDPQRRRDLAEGQAEVRLDRDRAGAIPPALPGRPARLFLKGFV